MVDQELEIFEAMDAVADREYTELVHSEEFAEYVAELVDIYYEEELEDQDFLFLYLKPMDFRTFSSHNSLLGYC